MVQQYPQQYAQNIQQNQPYQSYQPYQQQLYNPMLNAQQRLGYLEQQYPQFSQQYSQQNQQNQNQSMFLKCIPVTGIDEVKASIIDFDGSIHVFVDYGNGKIYTKKINNSGLATINTYIIENENNNQEQEQKQINNQEYVLKNDFENALVIFNRDMENIKNELKLIIEKEDNKNVQSANNSTKSSDQTSNGSSKSTKINT